MGWTETTAFNTRQHPWVGETVVFPTKHEKASLLRPLFESIGMNCIEYPADTDVFGTFTGEKERKGTVLETLRAKIQCAVEAYPKNRFFLASEGSFGPSPLVGLLHTDLEALLFWDQKFSKEIYAEHMDLSPVHYERVIGPRDNFRAALDDLSFPNHSVVVHPQGGLMPIFKGLRKEKEVAQALLECFSVPGCRKVVLKNDLRANHNPTRRQAIIEAGRALIHRISQLCSSCGYPGFSIENEVPGALCASCKSPTRSALAFVFKCMKCLHSEERFLEDAKKFVDPSLCDNCNP